MPIRKVCCRPGCDEIALEGKPHCELHDAEARAKLKRQRAKAKLSDEALAGAKLYASVAWRKLRKSYLKANPLCVDCADLGLVVDAKEVDHKEPHRGDRSLFFDRSNLQALCKSCHSRKTAREVLAPGGIEKS